MLVVGSKRAVVAAMTLLLLLLLPIMWLRWQVDLSWQTRTLGSPRPSCRWSWKKRCYCSQGADSHGPRWPEERSMKGRCLQRCNLARARLARKVRQIEMKWQME